MAPALLESFRAAPRLRLDKIAAELAWSTGSDHEPGGHPDIARDVLLEWLPDLGREPINSERSTDVRFGAHSGLKSDVTALPKCVESRCGAVALGRTYLLPPLSFGGASMVPPWLRFHIPLIEPDRQISRIRLSDKTSRFRVQRHLQLLNIYRS